MQSASSTMLSLGVVLDIIIFVLLILSLLLLYSLLSISMAQKTFSLGVLRMIGMSRKSLVLLLESQALLNALPAWALGLIIAQSMAIYVLHLLGSDSNISLDAQLTTTS